MLTRHFDAAGRRRLSGLSLELNGIDSMSLDVLIRFGAMPLSCAD
jgi:hypothetical protein